MQLTAKFELLVLQLFSKSGIAYSIVTHHVCATEKRCEKLELRQEDFKYTLI